MSPWLYTVTVKLFKQDTKKYLNNIRIKVGYRKGYFLIWKIFNFSSAFRTYIYSIAKVNERTYCTSGEQRLNLKI